ncbi:MAG: transcriptional regulator, GntR family [Phenylobacterium sp.]|nr:transcriptional regulator, GntR family [Phenylobacterium sp.]
MADGDHRDRAGPARAPGFGGGERTTIRIPKTAELVADSIRRQITGGALKEGDTLQPEAQIIEEFAVSRPTVREAFRILESEKLISVSRGSRGGARVHVPRPEQVARYAGFVLQSRKASYRDVYEARILIEPPAARHVAETRSKQAPPILRAVIQAQRDAEAADDFGRAVATFHTRLIELTGNQTLILISGMFDGIVAQFQSEVARLNRANPKVGARRRTEVGLKSQEKLVGFIEAGDGSGAEAHWRAHMENSAKVWLGGGPGDAVVNWTD